MNIVFRVDASSAIGTGQVMRCFTLAKALQAQALQKEGCTVSFICTKTIGNMGDWLKQHFPLYTLPACNSWEEDNRQSCEILSQIPGKIEWLILDHYGLDYRWETHIQQKVLKIMVIDDLADRIHNCHILLDQNLHEGWKTRYEDKVPKSCLQLLGTAYVLLNPIYPQFKTSIQERTGEIRRLLIGYGGSDPTHETEKVLSVIKGLKRRDFFIDVVVGKMNMRLAEISKFMMNIPRLQLHVHPDHVAHLMAVADMAFGAGGIMTWERCYMGLPSLVTVVVDNQRSMTEYMHHQKAIHNMGWHEQVKSESIETSLNYYLDHPNSVLEMSRVAQEIVDGKGVERVVKCLLER